MKKGCFIQIVFLVTILVAVIAYFIQTDRFEPIIKSIFNVQGDLPLGVELSLKTVKQTPEKDSLVTLAKEYYGIQGEKDEKELKKVEDIIRKSSKDSVISDKELEDFKQMIKELEIKYERSEKK